MNLLATTKYYLAANVNPIATNEYCLAANVNPLSANENRLEKNGVMRLGDWIGYVDRFMGNCAVFFVLRVFWLPPRKIVYRMAEFSP